MKIYKIIKFDKGRITIQTNSFGINELKIRIGEETHKIRCEYQKLKEIEKMVDMILSIKSI